MLKFSTYRLVRDLPLLNSANALPYVVSFCSISPNRLTPQLYSRFTVRRLSQRFSLFETIRVLKKYLSNSSLRGYLLRCSGRFTKKQRASVFTFRKGAAPIATVGASVHYYDASVKLKYGACCIKIWIYR